MDILKIRRNLIRDGFLDVGFSDLNGIVPESLAHLPWGISLVFPLSGAVTGTIQGAPTHVYFQHYRAVNALLDANALKLSAQIEREGYSAMPVAASQSIPAISPYSGLFQHKTAAVRAGLGWIGKSALLITPDHGPRVRLATVLTDMPLPVIPGPESAGCGDCTACAGVCPAGAIAGNNYRAGAGRSTIYDAQKCSAHMKTYQDIGRGAVCGICMAACPVGKVSKCI